MATVTISRQLGASGFQVAQEIATQLGYAMVWRNLINQAALRAGVPEVALNTFDEFNLLGVHPSPQARQAYMEAVAQIMTELANQGRVVIVGRAGQVILHGRSDVFHVRVVAPVEVRSQRLASTRGIVLEAARAQVEASDHTRRTYLSHYYHARWDDETLYDLIINTERLSPADASAMICQMLKLKPSFDRAALTGANIEYICE